MLKIQKMRLAKASSRIWVLWALIPVSGVQGVVLHRLVYISRRTVQKISE